MRFILVFIAAVITANIGFGNTFPNFDLEEYRRCFVEFLDNECTDGVTDNSPFAHNLQTAVECGNAANARHFAGYCVMNENGTRCGATVLYLPVFNSLSGLCYSSLIGSNCADSCRNALQSIREMFGCCINEAVNYTTGDFAYLAPVLNYSLWSRCDVETVPECDAEGRLLFTIPTNLTTRCNRTEEQRRQHDAICGDMVTVRNGGLQDMQCIETFNQVEADRCSRDENGTFCPINIEMDFEQFIIPILSACTNRVNCSNDCRNLLVTFLNNRGCCVNVLYNSSLAIFYGFNTTTASFLSDQSLFNLCNVQAPPLTCVTAVPDGSLQLKASFMIMLFLPSVVTMVNLLGR